MYFFSKNQNPGQRCHTSIDLTAVLERKSVKDFKKMVLATLIYPIIYIYWKFEQFWVEIYQKKLCPFCEHKTSKQIHRICQKWHFSIEIVLPVKKLLATSNYYSTLDPQNMLCKSRHFVVFVLHMTSLSDLY